MDKSKGLKVPVQLRVNMWLGLSANDKKFNAFAEGNFSVYAEMVAMAQSDICLCTLGIVAPSCPRRLSAVREPGTCAWQLGNHRPGGPPQVLRRDWKSETETGALPSPPRMGMGGRLVRRPGAMASLSTSLQLRNKHSICDLLLVCTWVQTSCYLHARTIFQFSLSLICCNHKSAIVPTAVQNGDRSTMTGNQEEFLPVMFRFKNLPPALLSAS